MIKKGRNLLYLTIITDLIIVVVSCNANTNCAIHEVRSDSNVATFSYDDQGDVSSVIVTDPKESTKETYIFKRDNEKITKIVDGNDSLFYYLDKKQRIISYTYSSVPDNVYESNLKYNQEGYLSTIEKQRFLEHGSRLFITNHITILYEDKNPVMIADSAVVAQDYISNGENSIVIYEISYYDPHDIEFVNQSIFTKLVSYLPEFTYVAYNGSIGILPNKLIKSIVSKTKGELSFRRFFRYKTDGKGNITQMYVSYKDVYNKPSMDSVRFSYNCKQ